MTFIWKEREHESHDMDVANDPAIMQTLINFGHPKFFSLPSMKSQMELLKYLVRAWDIWEQCYRIRAHTLSIKVEEIYFLIGFS